MNSFIEDSMDLYTAMTGGTWEKKYRTAIRGAAAGGYKIIVSPYQSASVFAGSVH